MTETNATSIGEPHSNFPAYDGQWRQAAWALVARGARMVEYWHWHSIHFGHETYWLGVLNHDGEPGRCYDEVKRIAGDFNRAGAAVTDLVPDADVGLLYSRESKWAMEFHPPLAARGQPRARPAAPTTGSSGASTRACSAPASRPTSSTRSSSAATPTRSSRAGRCSSSPALYVADDMLLDLLDAYARAGGHLVLGFRSGYADDEARPRPEVMPGRLREAVGASYGEYTNLAVAGAAAIGGGLRPARRGGRDGMGGRARAGGRRDARGLRRTRTSGAGRR